MKLKLRALLLYLLSKKKYGNESQLTSIVRLKLTVDHGILNTKRLFCRLVTIFLTQLRPLMTVRTSIVLM